MYRVVIGDDLEQFRRWLGELLEKSRKFQLVGEADTGQETIRLVRTLEPELAIVDLDMPDLDGLAVARALCDRSPHIKIVLVSNHAELDYPGIFQEPGVTAFIPKGRLSVAALCQILQAAAKP